MARRKSQQPLLYIHQPTFENKSPSMQQFFITKRTKQIEVVETNQKDKFIVDEVKAELNENVSTKTLSQHLELKLAHKIDLAFQEESQETNVMEFMLEGILTPGVEPEIEEEFPKDVNNMNKKEVEDVSVNIKNEFIQINKQVFETNAEVHDSIYEYKKEKREKRTSFNELSLKDKLKQLKKMPAMVVRFLYEFVTIEKKHIGYFITTENGDLIIEPPNDTNTITLTEKSIVDINRIGL